MQHEGLPDSISPDIEAFLARAKERAEARLPDGHFAEHQGQIAFSVLEQVMPLPLASAPHTVGNIIQTIPWNTPNAPRQLVAQVDGWTSLFNRALLACLDEPQAAESDEVFRILREFIPLDGHAVLTHTKLWRQRMHLLNGASHYVKHKQLFDQRAYGLTISTPAMEAFTDALESHVLEAAAAIYDNSEKISALTLIQLFDGSQQINEAVGDFLRTSQRSTKRLRRLRGVPEGLYDLSDETRSEAIADWQTNVFYIKIHDRLLGLWEQSQGTWNWEDINQILDAYPRIGSDEARMLVIDALEDAAEANLPRTLAGSELAVEGLAALIHADIHRNRPPQAMPPELFLPKGSIASEITFGDSTLPREYAPTASITLLGSLAEQLPPEETTGLLERVQRAIISKSVPTAVNDWLLTLALLRKHPDMQVGRLIDGFIDRDDFPHTAFRQLVTGKRPGHIYLLRNGKIRVDTNVASGYVLATSPAADSEQPAAPTPARQFTLTTSENPDRGVLSVPGVTTSKRRKRKETKRIQPATPEAAVAEEPSRPAILYTDEALASLGARLSPADLEVVRQALTDNQQYGRHPLEPLRGRSNTGALLCKLRVNGVGSGIRLVLEHVGGNQFSIIRINYRGEAYKNLPR